MNHGHAVVTQSSGRPGSASTTALRLSPSPPWNKGVADQPDGRSESARFEKTESARTFSVISTPDETIEQEDE